MVYAMCANQAVLLVTKSMGRHSPQRGRKIIAHGASHGTEEHKKPNQPRRGERPHSQMYRSSYGMPLFLRKLINSSWNERRWWCLSCSRMYFTTAAAFDGLTLNAP
jgi:hypothetical protein